MTGLTIVVGPMSAGKSEYLIERVQEARQQGRKAAAFVHELGAQRDGWQIRSRSGASVPARVVESTSQIVNTALHMPSGSLLVVDEVHFFDEGLWRLRRLVTCGFDVMAAGLDTDFRGEPFPSTDWLLWYGFPKDVIRLSATCAKCGAPATRTQRLVDGRPAPWDSPVIMVGGDEMYEPRCEKCHEVAGSPNPKRPKQRGDTR